MPGYITMSNQELQSVSVLERLIRHEITQITAAEILELSDRQVRRRLIKFKRLGVKGLVHGNRGRISKRRISPKEIKTALEIIKLKYSDFKPTLAHEKLIENYGVKFSVEKLRQAMIKAGLHQPKRKRITKVYQLRERRSCFGELIQADGSPHDWFEGRAPKCNLTVFVDDATGQPVWLEFNQAESVQSYFKAAKGYLTEYGKPVAFYVDKHSVFKVNHDLNLDFKKPQANEDENFNTTQFGRAMKELGINMIYANSPQAKGRVERLNQVLQDRLVKELRLRGINNITEANQYLPTFKQEYIKKFAVTPKSAYNAHRPLTDQDNLDEILTIQTHRILSKSLSCQYQNNIYQIKTKKPGYLLKHTQILIRENYDGQITIWHNQHKLDYNIIAKHPPHHYADSKRLNALVDQILIKPYEVNPYLNRESDNDEEIYYYKHKGAF